MIINLVEYINFVLKGACSLPISTLIKATSERIKSWFVEKGIKI